LPEIPNENGCNENLEWPSSLPIFPVRICAGWQGPGAVRVRRLTVGRRQQQLLGDADQGELPHNGVDYPGQLATGRFSNAQNLADFIG